MFSISSGVTIDVQKTVLDPDYIYIERGFILNPIKNECIVILDSKIKKNLGKINYVYYDTEYKNFVIKDIETNDSILLPISYLDISATGFLNKLTTPDNRTVIFEDNTDVILAKALKIPREKTLSNLVVVNQTITLSEEILDVVDIYVHGMGTITNPKDIINSIQNKIINLNTNELDNKIVDIGFQYLA